MGDIDRIGTYIFIENVNELALFSKYRDMHSSDRLLESLTSLSTDPNVKPK